MTPTQPGYWECNDCYRRVEPKWYFDALVSKCCAARVTWVSLLPKAPSVAGAS